MSLKRLTRAAKALALPLASPLASHLAARPSHMPPLYDASRSMIYETSRSAASAILSVCVASRTVRRFSPNLPQSVDHATLCMGRLTLRVWCVSRFDSVLAAE